MALTFAGRTWFNGEWTAREWARIRFVFVLCWLPWFPMVLFTFDGQPVPTGIAQWVDLSVLTQPGINFAVLLLALGACWFYLKGKWMLPATATMLVLGVLVFTLHDSQGAYQRNELMNLILLGQVAALVQARWKSGQSAPMPESQLRNALVFNSQQMLLACYFISAISKLYTAGLDWVIDSPNVSLQIYKSQMSLFYSVDWPVLANAAVFFSDLTASYPLPTQIVFAGALALELFGIAALLNRKVARWIGWGFLLMHLGIFVLLGVLFIPYLLLIIALLIGLPGNKGTVA